MAQDRSRGYELFISDITTTNLLVDLNPGRISSLPWDPTPVGNRYLFRATNAANGTELFATDGTAAGTRLLKDLATSPRNASSGVESLTSAGGTMMFFSANDGLRGEELWATSRAGTALVRDINPGSAGSRPTGFTPFWNGSRLLTVFAADAPAIGRELWITDGSPAGTTAVRDIHSGGSSSPTDFAALGRRVFFAASGGSASGRELWATDGTAAGTSLVKDIVPGASSSSPQSLVTAGGKLFFAASTIPAGRELWVSDGTAAGTTMVADLAPGVVSTNPVHLVSCRERVVFAGLVSSGGSGVWVSDGTASGTIRLGTFTANGAPRFLTRVGDEVYFNAEVPGSGRELWKTDLTPAGTRMVKDILPGGGGSNPGFLTAVGTRVYFTAQDPVLGRELFYSDGTAAGTVAVDIDPGARSSNPGDLVAAGGGVYFSATNINYPADTGRELWFSDGTTARTRVVCDVDPGERSGSPGQLTLFDSNLYFTAVTGSRARELYRLTQKPAVSEVLGPTCGATQSLLRSTDLRLASTAMISGYDAPMGSGGLLFIGVPSGNPIPLPGSLVDPDCPLWVNIFLPTIQLAIPASRPSWTIPLPIPNQPSLLDNRVAMQGLYLPPIPGVWTNGLMTSVGR